MLKGVSLEVKEGQTVAIVGATGAGVCSGVGAIVGGKVGGKVGAGVTGATGAGVGIPSQRSTVAEEPNAPPLPFDILLCGLQN